MQHCFQTSFLPLLTSDSGFLIFILKTKLGIKNIQFLIQFGSNRIGEAGEKNWLHNISHTLHSFRSSSLRGLAAPLLGACFLPSHYHTYLTFPFPSHPSENRERLLLKRTFWRSGFFGGDREMEVWLGLRCVLFWEMLVRGEVQAAWMELDLRMIAPLVRNLTLGMELGGQFIVRSFVRDLWWASWLEAMISGSTHNADLSQISDSRCSEFRSSQLKCISFSLYLCCWLVNEWQFRTTSYLFPIIPSWVLTISFFLPLAGNLL